MRKLELHEMEMIEGGDRTSQICNAAGVVGSGIIGSVYGAAFGGPIGFLAGGIVGFAWGAACATYTPRSY